MLPQTNSLCGGTLIPAVREPGSRVDRSRPQPRAPGCFYYQGEVQANLQFCPPGSSWALPANTPLPAVIYLTRASEWLKYSTYGQVES